MDAMDMFEYDDDQSSEEVTLEEEEDYNALNDETFGSTAVDYDWEQNHEELALLTENEKLGKSEKEVDGVTNSAFNNGKCLDIESAIRNFSLDNVNTKKLIDSFSDSNHFHQYEADLSQSPGHSIWSPTHGSDKVGSPSSETKNLSIQNHSINFNAAQNVHFNSVQHKPLLSSFKTVSELEDEMKRNHINQQKMAQNLYHSQNRVHYDQHRVASPYIIANAGVPIRTAQVPAVLPHPNWPRPRPLLERPMQPPLQHQNQPPLQQHHQPPLQQRHQPHFNQRREPHHARSSPPRLQQRHENNHRYRGFPNGNYAEDKNRGGGAARPRRESESEEWDEWRRKRELDEYSGLMTPREKTWLRNIQSMQLQSENPYETDYYYVMFKVRQHRRREEDAIEINGAQMLLPDKGRDDKEYVPPRLENSLGKLQAISVNAPRKIIDLKVVHLDAAQPVSTLQRDMRKHRQFLINLEKLYDINIELDDLSRKIRALPDCPTRDLFRSKCKQLVSDLWQKMTSNHEFFVQVLCIRKGKSLVARFLSWLDHGKVEHVFATLVQNWPVLSKRDAHDGKLASLWPGADRLLSLGPASALINLAIMVTPHLAASKSGTVPLFSNRLGISMAILLLVRGECDLGTDANCEPWQDFAREALRAFSIASSEDLEPLPSVTLNASFGRASAHLSKIKGPDPTEKQRAAEFLKRLESCMLNKSPK